MICIRTWLGASLWIRSRVLGLSKIGRTPLSLPLAIHPAFRPIFALLLTYLLFGPYLSIHHIAIHPLTYSAHIGLPTRSLLIIPPPIIHSATHLLIYNNPSIYISTISPIYPSVEPPTHEPTTICPSTHHLSIHILISCPLIYSYMYHLFIYPLN